MTNPYLFLPSALFMGAALLTSGCYYHHTEQDRGGRPVQALEETTICCEALDELSYRELQPNVELPILLDDRDPVYEFENGKSYVEPFKLPESNGIVLLQVDSLAGKWQTTGRPTVVFPVITLLDSNYNQIATLEDLPYEVVNPWVGQKLLRVVATIDDRYPDARYALIHTSKTRLNQSISTRKPYAIVRTSNFDTMLYDQTTTEGKWVRFTHSGAMNLRAYPMQ